MLFPNVPKKGQLFFFSVVDPIVVVCTLENFGQPLAFGVCMIPEVEEEAKEDQAIYFNDVDKERVWVWAILHEEVLAAVASDDHELELKANRSISLKHQLIFLLLEVKFA